VRPVEELTAGGAHPYITAFGSPPPWRDGVPAKLLTIQVTSLPASTGGRSFGGSPAWEGGIGLGPGLFDK